LKEVTELDLFKLTEVFPPKWRIQSFDKYENKARCVAYFKKETAEDILNNNIGRGNWQRKHSSFIYEKDKSIVSCSIGIKIKGEWIWREDAGDSGQREELEEKSLMTNSFKRAASAWGIGDFLYKLGFPTIDTNKVLPEQVTKTNPKPHPVDEKGEKIPDWNFSDYLNETSSIKKKLEKLKNEYQEALFKLGDKDWKNILIDMAIKDVLNSSNLDELRIVREKFICLEKPKVAEYIKVLKERKEHLEKVENE